MVGRYVRLYVRMHWYVRLLMPTAEKKRCLLTLYKQSATTCEGRARHSCHALLLNNPCCCAAVRSRSSQGANKPHSASCGCCTIDITYIQNDRRKVFTKKRGMY